MEIICRIVLSVLFTSLLSVACQMSQDCTQYVLGWVGGGKYVKIQEKQGSI